MASSLFLDFPCQSELVKRRLKGGKPQAGCTVLLMEWCAVDVLVAIATDNHQVLRCSLFLNH